MDPMVLVLIVTGLLLLLLVLGMPVSFALAMCGAIGLAALRSLGLAAQMLGVTPLERIGNYSLTMVPMFILMGALAFTAGLSRVAFDVGYKWLVRIPAGLGVATMAAGAIFGAVSGSSTATAAALGRVAIPEMRRLGYDKKLAAGCVAAAALVDNLIPPSIGFVIYGILTGESIGKLLMSGVVPGLLTMVGFSLMLIILALRAPHLLPSGMKVSWREKFASLPGLFPLAILFIVVLGGIYTGIVTPTEAAAVGAMTTFIMTVIALLRRRTTWSETRHAFRETISTSAMIFTLFVGAGIFSFFLTMAGVPLAIERAITDSSLPAVGVLLVVTVIYLILGMFLDPMSIMVITIPIVYPTMIALGYNGIWLGVIVVKLIGIGLITPPVGLNVYVVKSVVPDLTLEDAFKGIGYFLIAEAVLLAILLAFPELSLWLPARMK